jgi:hypothetical protein
MPDRRAATINTTHRCLARQSRTDNHADAATPDSHPDCRCLPIQIAALQPPLLLGRAQLVKAGLLWKGKDNRRHSVSSTVIVVSAAGIGCGVGFDNSALPLPELRISFAAISSSVRARSDLAPHMARLASIA